jgi:hypothetical protein
VRGRKTRIHDGQPTPGETRVAGACCCRGGALPKPAELFRSQLADGPRKVYDRGFRYWALWRSCRGRGPHLLGACSFEDEGELIKFVAHFGVVCEYAHSTVHGWLYGVQHGHIRHGWGDPLANKPRLRLVRKGLKRLDRRRRGPTRKLAVTVGLILEVLMHGGLDFAQWDDADTAERMGKADFHLMAW